MDEDTAQKAAGSDWALTAPQHHAAPFRHSVSPQGVMDSAFKTKCLARGVFPSSPSPCEPGVVIASISQMRPEVQRGEILNLTSNGDPQQSQDLNSRWSDSKADSQGREMLGSNCKRPDNW